MSPTDWHRETMGAHGPGWPELARELSPYLGVAPGGYELKVEPRGAIMESPGGGVWYLEALGADDPLGSADGIGQIIEARRQGPVGLPTQAQGFAVLADGVADLSQEAGL